MESFNENNLCVVGELGSLICEEPTKGECLLEEVIMCVIHETAVEELPGGLGLEQIHAPLRISCLPKSKLLQHCMQQGINGLVIVQGVLSAFTTTIKYT